VITILVGLVCLMVGTCAGALVVAILNAASNADDDAAYQLDNTHQANAELLIEVAKLRRQLATCQEISRQNAEKAETYYALFCQGAQANAALKHGR
jgi:hypothetical protein